MKTYVIGHLKPDTDSVVAAMALASMYQQIGSNEYQNIEAAITAPVNPETEFLLNKFNLEAPKIITANDLNSEDQIILVDHNEEDQRLEGLNQDQIVEIVDHHKAKLNFSQPINMTFRTWGSSNTIIYALMQENNFVPDHKLASMMLAAILSDTVGFKSATCTLKDKELAKELATIAEISDLDAFTLEIFKAKSDVSKLSCEDIVKNDYKIFDFAGKKIMIDQLETVEQEAILNEKKDCLLKAMEKVKVEQAVDMIFVVVTDILKVNSKVLILDQEAEMVATKAFGGSVNQNVLDIGQRMSRKKEIAPFIEKAVS